MFPARARSCVRARARRRRERGGVDAESRLSLSLFRVWFVSVCADAVLVIESVRLLTCVCVCERESVRTRDPLFTRSRDVRRRRRRRRVARRPLARASKNDRATGFFTRTHLTWRRSHIIKLQFRRRSGAKEQERSARDARDDGPSPSPSPSRFVVPSRARRRRTGRRGPPPRAGGGGGA